MHTTCSRRMMALAATARSVLDREARRQLVDFLSARFNPDGGARGREAGSDLYYTLFTAGALQALGGHPPRLRVLRYIRGFQLGRELDFVHRACLARLAGVLPSLPAKRKRILEGVEAYRAGDGGYHHLHAEAPTCSAYGAFLALQAYEDLGALPPRPDDLAVAVAARLDEEGTTTGLCAAVCTLHQVKAPVPRGTADRIRSRQLKGGGFKAHASAPADDLLSTAVSLFTLHLLGTDLHPAREGCLALVEDCWQDDGGFGGWAGDAASDSEYTFYALLALGCLTA